MSGHFTLMVSAESSGQRLDQFLHRELSQYSRAFLQKLLSEGRVTLDDRMVKASHRVRGGERIVVTVPPPAAAVAKPEPIDLAILHEDDDLVVINKATGMVVHPAAGNRDGTLVNALLHHCRGQLAGVGGVERPGIVHRLDKETSGCVVVAKTDTAHRDLVRQFQSRSVIKIYRAVCWGVLSASGGRIDTLIGRSDRNRKKMAVLPPDSHRGKQAVTDYRVLRQGPHIALLELTLHSGRTHQIRVHLAHLHHPIVGDSVYGGKMSRRKTTAQTTNWYLGPDCDRMMLHAYQLGFNHPRRGEPMVFTAPLPPIFEQIMDCDQPSADTKPYA